MKHLHFLGKFYDSLINGKKDITIRLDTYGLKTGDIFIIHCGGYVIGKYRVKRIYVKKLSEITDDEAKRDGYKNKEELINDLRNMYPNIKEDSKVFIIEFEPIEIFKEKILSEDFAYLGKKVNIIELAKKILENVELNDKEKEILNILIEEGSIRKAAKRLGGLEKRNIIRRVIRKGFRKLIKKGII